MEKIKSLADLKKIRDNVQSKIDLREKSEHPENLIQIKVAMATCGIAAGSKETMNYFLNNLEKNGIQAVVTQTGCMRSEERRVGKECRSRWSPYH